MAMSLSASTSYVSANLYKIKIFHIRSHSVNDGSAISIQQINEISHIVHSIMLKLIEVQLVANVLSRQGCLKFETLLQDSRGSADKILMCGELDARLGTLAGGKEDDELSPHRSK